MREDYSPGGTAWEYFPHDHARSRAYRWNEDGLAGNLRPAPADLLRAGALERPRSDSEGAPLRPDRHEGNHGEDVKEYYYYLDTTPTHSYMKCLYKYPQAEFPYAQLVEENRRRTRQRSGVRTDRHRRVRREPLLRRVRGVRQGHRPTTSWSASRSVNRGPGSADAARAADNLVSQYVVAGATPASSARIARRPASA